LSASPSETAGLVPSSLAVILKHMRFAGLFLPALFLTTAALPASAVQPVSCSSGARSFLPCELTFDLKQGDVQASTSAYANDMMRVEFRSPTHKTYLMHAFADAVLRVRFSPTEAGTWTYHVLSEIPRYNDKEETFSVADSGFSGMVNVANLRHWRSTDKKPHLWLAAGAPFATMNQTEWETWLDARKHDGFTHIRGALLIGTGMKPFDSSGLPNAAYFSNLDDRLLAAAARGFTLDLLFADHEFAATGSLNSFDQHESLIRYLVARYGGLCVTWQGIEDFENTDNSRAILKSLASFVQKYDSFNHPRSTDARASSFPLVADGWMNFLMEASPDPQLGAIDHQFTDKPEIHIINSTAPDVFRHELWNCTANGEYPSVSFETLQNQANIQAIHTWVHILSDTRHWEFEPYFEISGARAVGLNEVEYLAYAQDPGIVEITLPHHKYNPLWINPSTGEELYLKDYRGEVFSRPTPGNSHDWILQVPREGKKESMLKYFYFESEDPPVQEVDSDIARIPFALVDPAGEEIKTAGPAPYSLKITRANRASRQMQYAWWGEVVGSETGARLLGLGSSGSFTIPKELLKQSGTALNVRVLAINANGKAYELDKIYRLTP